jgi:hypothetical protein
LFREQDLLETPLRQVPREYPQPPLAVTMAAAIVKLVIRAAAAGTENPS